MRVNLGSGNSNDNKSIDASNDTKASAVLPTFYNALPTENDELKQKLREEARAQFLQVC
jgi:hypothetical protein